MNFLQLAQQLGIKCRVTGSALVTTQNQGTEYARMIGYLNEAWMDIQGQRDNWWWMRASFSFTTVAGQTNYTLASANISDFGNWDTDTIRNYVTAVGVQSEMTLDEIAYDVWRDNYYLGAQRNVISRPIVFAVAPDKSLVFGAIADNGYTIGGDYFRVATPMTSDLSTPALPAQYHQAIIYRAMMFYGMSEAATEIYQEGQTEYSRYMNRIMRNQQNVPVVGAALV